MTRFAFLADPQLGCRATFSGLDDAAIESLARRGMYVDHFPAEDGHAWDASQLEKAVAAVNEAGVDFVVFGGDMIDDARREDQLADLTALTDQLEAEIRWAPGNHDCAFDGEQPTHRSLAHYNELFGPDWYGFHTAEASFVVLNTTVLHRPERVPDRYDDQFTFLRQQLETSATRGGPTILLGHHPLFLRTWDEPDTYWNVPFRARDIIFNLAESFDVSTMFAGHYHRNNVAQVGPFEMVTSGPVGFPLGDDPPGIRIVDVTSTRINHRYQPLPE